LKRPTSASLLNQQQPEFASIKYVNVRVEPAGCIQNREEKAKWEEMGEMQCGDGRIARCSLWVDPAGACDQVVRC
jgi:hypothetical protein